MKQAKASQLVRTKNIFKYAAQGTALLAMMANSGCVSDYYFTQNDTNTGETGGSGTGGPGTVGGPSGSSINPIPSPSPSTLVCNPFGGVASGNVQNGLVGSLTYIPDTSAVVSTSADIDALRVASFEPGAPSVVSESTQLFLSNVDVPDQNFLDGFSDSKGNTLKDLNGNTLVQFFALHLDSNLIIPAGKPAMNVQLAVMSDDGSIVYIGTPGGTAASATTQLINNDATQSNTLACATQVLDLIPGVPVPIHIEYFQGPMVRLGLMLFWRPQADMSTQEPFCSVHEGDTFFFTDSGTGPTPTSNYQAMLARGWELVPAENFELAAGTTNPCNMPSPTPSGSASPTPTPSPSASPPCCTVKPSPSPSPSTPCCGIH